MSAGRSSIEWKSRRREVPQGLEPSLSDGAFAEEEGLDRFCVDWHNKEKWYIF